MADDAAESALRYLRDPAVVSGLGAIAVASMYYLASRPTPQPCPVDPQKQSFELPASILTTPLLFLTIAHWGIFKTFQA